MASLNFGTLHATITANATQYTKTINEMQQTTAAAMAAIAKSIEAATNQLGKSVQGPDLSNTISQIERMIKAAAAAAAAIAKVGKSVGAGTGQTTEAGKAAANAKAIAKDAEVIAASEIAIAAKSSTMGAKAFAKRIKAQEEEAATQNDVAAKYFVNKRNIAEAAAALELSAAAKSSLAGAKVVAKRIKDQEAEAAAQNDVAIKYFVNKKKIAEAAATAATAELSTAAKSSIAGAKAFAKRIEAAETEAADRNAKATKAGTEAYFNRIKANEAATTAESASIRAGAVKLLASIRDGVKDQEAAKAAGVKLAFKNQATADAASIKADKASIKDREAAAAAKVAAAVKENAAAVKLATADAKSINKRMRAEDAETTRTATTGRTIEEPPPPKRSFGEMAQVMGNELQSVAGAFYTYLSKPLIDFGKYSVDVANQFEIAMSRITGLVGIASTQVNLWSQELRNIGPGLGKGPEELAKGLYFITSSGQRGAQAMDVLVTSAKASSAGLGEVKTVADAVTSAINAYGEANLSAGRAADIITAAVREGKFEASGLATVIGRVLPLAKAMGVDFAEAAGAMAAMTRVGATIQQAGVSMTAVFGGILKPTKEAKEELAQYNLTFHQLREMMKQPGGFIKFMRLLDDTFKGNEESMGRVFSDMRELRGVMNLLAQDGKKVDGVMQGVRDSVGDNERAFQAWADTNASKFVVVQQQMLVAFTDIGLAIGATLLPALGAISATLNWGIEGFKTLNDTTKATIIIIGMVVAAIGPFLLAIAAIVKAVAFMNTTLYLGTVSLVALKVALIAVPVLFVATSIAVLTAALSQATIAQDEFNAAVARSKKVQNEIVGTRQKRFDKDIAYIQEMDNPHDRLEEVENQLEQAKKELAGANNTIANAKAEVANSGGVVRSALSYVPVAGRRFTIMADKAAQDLSDAEANALSFTKQVERLTSELEKTKLEVSQTKDNWSDPTIGRSIEAVTAKLKLQAITLRMTHGEIEIYKLKLLKATDSQLNGVKAWAAYFDAMKKQKKAFEKAKEVIKDIATPQEKFQAQVVELDEMLAHGVISVEQYARAFAKAKNEMAGANKELHKFDAASSSSNEALDRISKWRDKMDVALPDIGAAKKRKEELEGTIARKPVDIPIPKSVTDIITKAKAAASSFWDIFNKPKTKEEEDKRKAQEDNDAITKGIKDRAEAKKAMEQPGYDENATDPLAEAYEIVRKAKEEKDRKALEKEREGRSFQSLVMWALGIKDTKGDKEAAEAAKKSEEAVSQAQSIIAEKVREAELDAKLKKSNETRKGQQIPTEAEKAAEEAEVAAKKAKDAAKPADEANKAAKEAELKLEEEEYKVRKAAERAAKEAENKAAIEELYPEDRDVASLTDDKGSILDILKSIAATNAAMAKKNNMEIEPANLVA